MARVLMFGVLQDLAGWRTREIDTTSLSALTDLLMTEDAVLGERLSRPGVFAVVNQTMVRTDVILAPDDEVAFVPPVSGG
ncbi:MoaD/ThiS family protein [Brevundimonas variabilis]|uniref:Molybdopterin synthase sulfur carrier subunit n=1 Tax=Brevundimonas variabilis TaxID=74312 RepID=A0A7W9CHN5_9CAUL|nr:MoaD/ThiS family protein [Brevundimonas variabilis]MBB5745412.1 molybdopterin synthase sulfur carrier subunit [Brevundimonas variabilis]